jgi:hypothetical protein
MEAQLTLLIEQILQRSPEPGEIDSWIALINNPSTGLDLDGVRDRIVNSAEAVDTVYPVIRAYQAVYGRVPDAGGLDFWTDHYRVLKNMDDASTPTVHEGMVELLKPFVDPIQTPEFIDRFGANPNANQYVYQCYLNVLGRLPDPSGQAYWEARYTEMHAEYTAANPGMSLADVNILTRAVLLEQFVNSQEYTNAADPFIDEFLTGAADETESYVGPLWDRAPYSLEVANVAVVEGDTGSKTVTLTLVLDEAPSADLTLTYKTGGGTATPDDDYIPQTGTVTIKAGETTAQITVTVLGDLIPEAAETFNVTFTAPVGVPGSPSLIRGGSEVATVTIIDDEATVIPLTPSIDIITGGPSNEVFLSSDDELGGNDRLNGAGGEDTLYHMINRASDFAQNATWSQRFSITDDLAGDAGKFLAEGQAVVWSGFQTESIEVLAIQNNDEWFFGRGEAEGQYNYPYGYTGFSYGGYGYDSGLAALVDVNGMKGLQTVVFYQQNGVTGVRDLQASHIAHDGVHVALIDIEGFHGEDASSWDDDDIRLFDQSEYNQDAHPNRFQILEQDNPWTCADESGLPRQIAASVDTIIDFDAQATRGENTINVLLNEVALGNLWFTQNLDNRDGELAEIEHLNLILPAVTELPGTQFDGIAGEPALINRIWASSTLESITVTGDDVTELVNGGPDDQYDLMLGIPILATPENWVGSGAAYGDPWGLDVGLPGLKTFDASAFNGDLLLTLYNAVGMDIKGGSGDDDFFINADDGEMGNLGWYTADNGRLQDTTIDGGEGFNVLWLPMSEADGYPNSPNGELGFDAVGPGNTLVNIDKIVFYGAIGESSIPEPRVTNLVIDQPSNGSPYTNAYELNVDYLGLDDPSRTELVFDGSIGASTLIFDNFGTKVVDGAQIINVKFTDIGGYIRGSKPNDWNDALTLDGRGPYTGPIYAPTLAFVPDAVVDPTDAIRDIVNVTFADDTRHSTYVTITDDEMNGNPGVDNKFTTSNNEADDEWDGELDILNDRLWALTTAPGFDPNNPGAEVTELRDLIKTYNPLANPNQGYNDGDVNHEVDVLNIHMEDSDCGVANCLHVGIKSMTELEEITLTDDDYIRTVTPAMAAFFSYLASGMNNGPVPGLSEADYDYFYKLFGLSQEDQANGNGVPLPENFAELKANDTFVVHQSFAIGAAVGDGYDSPNLKLFDAGAASADVDMWLNNSAFGDGYNGVGYEDNVGGPNLYHLDFYHLGATIITGSGNDRVIDGAGADNIVTGDGCDLVMAIYGGDDEIHSGGGDDLVVGGDGDDDIWGGDGNDLISGDSFGWLLSLLTEDCLDIRLLTAAQFLDFFCCIESECFKDEFQAGESISAGLLAAALDPGQPAPHNGTTYTLLDGDGYNGLIGLQSGGALYQYFVDQGVSLDTKWPVELSLCDIADALRDGELNLRPYSGTVTLEFDCHNEAVWNFILEILEQPLESLGLLHLVGADNGESLAEVLANIGAYVDHVDDAFGDDHIWGDAGDDIIHGGSGDDRLYGGAGADVVVGGDDSDVVDGGAGADMMVGGNTGSVQLGTPQVTTFALSGLIGKGYVGDGDDVNGPNGDKNTANLDGDSFTVTINGVDYNSIAGPTSTAATILADLASQINGALGSQGFSAEVSGGNLVVTGPYGTPFTYATSDLDGPAPDTFSPQITTATVGAGPYDIGDIISFSLGDLGITDASSAALQFVVTEQGMSANDVAAALRAMLAANSAVAANLSVSGTGADIVLTGNNPEDIFTATPVTVDNAAAGMIHTLDLLNASQVGPGTMIQITATLAADPGNPHTFTITVGPDGDLQAAFEAFISANASNISTITGGGNDLLYIDDQGKLAIYDEGGVPGDVTFAVVESGPGPAGFHIDSAASVVTANVDGPAPVTVAATNGQDNTQHIALVSNVDVGPSGEDGSDQFVAQTDGVLADSWYSNLYGPPPGNPAYPHTVNQLDHILDFWSSQNPDVVSGDEARDYLGFRNNETGDLVNFNPSGNPLNTSWYAEQHNVANTYEDALATANSWMANGTTKVVAISYNLGVDDNCDTYFDENEDFLVVFADTDGDKLADTAVRLIGRDDVTLEFHHQDVIWSLWT